MNTGLKIRLSKIKTYSKMLGKRTKKYFFFIVGLCLLSIFPGNRKRGRIVQFVYSFCRDVDDVIDGDEPLPSQYESTLHFINAKIAFIDNPELPTDDIEVKIKKSLEIADSMGHDIRKGIKWILSSMKFDAMRLGRRLIFPSTVIRECSDRLDIEGCVRESLRLYGENEEKLTPIVGLLGRASRIYYTLRDFESEDIPAGLINIPLEDIIRLGISVDTLSTSSPAVQMWFREQAMEGLALIREYKKGISGIRLRLITRLTLVLAFEHSAKKYFGTILTEPPWE